ncbi:cytochrome oxidase complex assembly protein 1-domain-containing protein [Phellopilus nigrolimitatus]|nr:cytochrome oxidase complex assembly protein 1-domain-containing protein [Phellopilus nigrolimitatus]
MPKPETFESVARPGAYYERPRIKRDLPIVTSPWMGLLAFGFVGVAGWGAFIKYTTNQERLASSVVRQILQNLRESDLVRETLGEGVRPEPTWYLNGDPWIDGTINMLQGNVDITLRVKGSKGAGTLYFTSIRKEKGQPFTLIRFKIICDSGTVIHLPIGLSKQ